MNVTLSGEVYVIQDEGMRVMADCDGSATAWTSLPRAARVAAVLAAFVLAACEPSTEVAPLGPAAAAQSFGLAGTNLRDGGISAGGALRVRFTRTLDVGSVGRRSVRVLRAGQRPIRKARAWVEGSTLVVAPPAGREFPIGEVLMLRVHGLPSPRAVRSMDGEMLSERLDLPFRAVARRRADLEGPRLVASTPSDGATGATPGSHVELRFSEPLLRGAIRRGQAVSLTVDREAVAVQTRISPDLTRIVVRPRRPLPPDADVVLSVRPTLVDTAGNPARAATIAFRTEATRLHRLTEEFITTGQSDPEGTTAGWADPRHPGYLVARAGRLVWSASEHDGHPLELRPRDELLFQVLFPADAAPSGSASGMRLWFAGATPGSEVEAVAVLAGSSPLTGADPTFDANRVAADLRDVARTTEPLVVEITDDGLGYVDVPFQSPVRLVPGLGTLVEVRVHAGSELRLAATLDVEGLALVADAGVDRLMPAAALLVTGGAPRALSTWYDAGAPRPAWRSALVRRPPVRLDPGVMIEFQTTAAGPDGRPDVALASAWEADLSRVPGLRFVRFRVRFGGLGTGGDLPRLDTVEMPYED